MAVNSPQTRKTSTIAVVFVLENVLNLYRQPFVYSSHYLGRDPLDSSGRIQWPGQREVKWRRRRLLDCVQHLFDKKNELGTDNIETMISKDPELASFLRQCLADAPEEDEGSPR